MRLHSIADKHHYLIKKSISPEDENVQEKMHMKMRTCKRIKDHRVTVGIRRLQGPCGKKGRTGKWQGIGVEVVYVPF